MTIMSRKQAKQAATVAELAPIISPEVKVAVVQAVLSEGNVEVSEVLLEHREETMALVARIMAAAGIKGGLPSPKTGNSKQESLSTEEKELSPEDIDAYLEGLKPRFEALKRLRPGLTFEEVKKALRANPEAIKKLIKLDAAGFEMNVFRSSIPDEIVFRAAQLDVTKIDSRYRTIMADKQSQLEYPEYKVNGNAEEISGNLGVELADGDLYEQLRVQNGWVWLKTDAETRKSGVAFYGSNVGISTLNAYYHDDYGSICASLRVKKA